LAADLVFSAKPSQIEVERRCEPIFSLGAPNPVRLRLRNRSRQAIEGRLRDEYPPELSADAVILDCRVGPGESADVEYHLTPTRRGALVFGNLNLRYRTRLGLWQRQVRFEAGGAVRVYPN